VGVAIALLSTVSFAVRPIVPVSGIAVFFQAASSDQKQAAPALAELARTWRPGYAALIVDLARFIVPRPPAGPPVGARTIDLGSAVGPDDPGARRPQDFDDPNAVPARPLPARQRLIALLEKQTGRRFGNDLGRWREWIWTQPYDPHPDYMAFKAALYKRVDPRMAGFFTGTPLIRLDEVDWGGVKVNGIPPLIYPKTSPASQATWLKDSHVVFGVAIGSEARAYPKRILAWHEMALDRLGGVELTMVYCTLCGTVIPYESVVGGAKRTFGTSGLLYRSNKLMFDAETMSLWSTLEGGPVIGPLAGTNARLRAHPVVTTTWGEWRRSHPNTSVLSLDTGHDRDYSEGAAYREYFSTDRLMFRVPRVDRRLKNKDEVLGILLPAQGGGRQAVALATSFLATHPVYAATFEGQAFVILTTPNGANRVYDAGPHRFTAWQDGSHVVDADGRPWRVTEGGLIEESSGRRLPRRTAFRAFWFGWHAQFPDTELIK
jgi:hypothetical protein